jgi:hypothetical protein
MTTDRDDLDQLRRPFTAERLWRAIKLAEIGGIALLNVFVWFSYRRRRVRWRAQGAVARWEHDFARRRARRRGHGQAKWSH